MINKIGLGVLSVVIGLCLMVGDASSLNAQESDTEEFTLEEITVTAQKREENLQKVAITMDTISGYELTERGAVNLTDILSNISYAIVQQAGENALNVSIRGLDSDTPPGGVASMVAVTVDGIYSNGLGLGQSGVYDMDRVEVLAGPQGTLYSRNSSAGVVNLVSKDPTDEFEASGSIEYGNYSLLNTQGALNIPVNEKVSLRGAFSSVVRDGYVSNGTDDNDSRSARLKMKYEPSQRFSILLAVETTRTDGKGKGGSIVEFGTDQPANPWTAEIADGSYYSNNKDIRRYSLNLEADVGIGDLTFLPNYTTTDVDSTSPSTNRATGEIVGQGEDTSNEREKSAELRLASYADSRFKWMTGAYYYARKVEQFGESPSALTHRLTDVESQAVFANLTYPVTDRFRLTLGGRYTEDDGRNMSELIIGPMYDLLDDENPGTNFDYKLTAEYDVSQDAMVWADFSTGYRQGMGTYSPEYVDAYQMGYKSRFLDQRAQFNASGFYYDYSNFSVTQMKWYVEETTGIEMMDRGSANGTAQMYGLDLQGDFILSPKDRFDLSVSYLNTEVSNCILKFEHNPDETGYEGGIMNNAPEWSISAGYEHRFPLANGGDITAKVDTRYRTDSQVSFDPEDTDENTEPTHHISNASLTYNSPGGKWNLTGYMKNIEDHPEKQGSMGFRLGPPRTYGIVLSVQYY